MKRNRASAGNGCWLITNGLSNDEGSAVLTPVYEVGMTVVGYV